MTTMQKFKAYFGMVPPAEYEDDYLADPMHDGYDPADRYPEPASRRPAPAGRGDEPMSSRERLYLERYRTAGGGQSEGYYDDEPYEAGYAEVEYAARGDDRVYAERAVRVEAAPAPSRGRLEPLSHSGNVTAARGGSGTMAVRGANALAPESRPAVAAESRVSTPASEPRSEAPAESPGKITAIRPADYSEARTIGERFRSGNPVIMDLSDLSNDDARRLVDFAAGLAFGLRGAFDKVAKKVFLLSPAGTDVSPEERRRLAESGFHNQA
ncbi:MAG: cell division protein SepF [Gordonia sp. (in: high G+C Gram-positive bacteria)]|uniref:cell division protein SepF n=1 Tax=Gordonia sp. (in: high G+C Gram-positive bacteria) TaxID=84139 RepID=UPI0039E63E87